LGSPVSCRVCGKLYLDVVAYCNCSINYIHQFTIIAPYWYLNVAHLEQHNKQYKRRQASQ
jgi:hypothetical protein